MQSNLNLDDEKKLDVLKFLITENNKELVYWRDRNWNTLKLAVGSYIALSGASYFKEGAYPLVLLVIGIAIISTVYLNKNFKRYQEKRDMGTRLEAALCLFTDDAFLKDTSLYPKEFMTPKAAKSGSYSFIAAIWIVAAASVVSMILSAINN